MVDRSDRRRDSGRRPPRRFGWLWEPPALVALALGSSALGVALLAAANERGADPRGGSADAPRVERPAATDALARALARPHRHTLDALGPHRLRDRSELRLRGGGSDGSSGSAIDVLDVDTEIAWSGSGDLRARTQNSAGSARDLVITGETIYTRPGYGPFHRRAPETADEAFELADELASTPGTYAAALLPGAAIAARREVERGGRPALAIALTTGEAGAPSALGEDVGEGAAVARVSGEIVLDKATDALLAADVSGRLTLFRGDRALDLEISFSREVEDVGVARTIEPPAGDVVLSPLDASHAHNVPIGDPVDRRDVGAEPWNEP